MNIFQDIAHAGFLEEITRHLHPWERISLARAAGIPREYLNTPQPFFRFRGVTYLTPSYCSYKLNERNHLNIRLPELFRKDLVVTASPVFKALYATARPDAVTFMDATDEMLLALLGSHPRAGDWFEDNLDAAYPDYAYENTINLDTPEQVILYQFFAAEKQDAPWGRFYTSRIQIIQADFAEGFVPECTRDTARIITENILLFTCSNIADYAAADPLHAQAVVDAMVRSGKAGAEIVHSLLERGVHLPMLTYAYRHKAVFRAAVDTGYIFLSDHLSISMRYLDLRQITYLFDALISRGMTVRVSQDKILSGPPVTVATWSIGRRRHPPRFFMVLMSRMMQLISPREILSILPATLGVIASFKQHLPEGTDLASLCSAWWHPIALGIPGPIPAVGVSWKNCAMSAIKMRNLDYFQRLASIHQDNPQTISSTSAVYKQAIISADVRFMLVCEQVGFNLRDADRIAALAKCQDQRIIDAFA